MSLLPMPATPATSSRSALSCPDLLRPLSLTLNFLSSRLLLPLLPHATSAHALIMDSLTIVQNPSAQSLPQDAARKGPGYPEFYQSGGPMSFDAMERMGVDRDALMRLDAIRNYLFKVIPLCDNNISYFACFHAIIGMRSSD